MEFISFMELTVSYQGQQNKLISYAFIFRKWKT